MLKASGATGSPSKSSGVYTLKPLRAKSSERSWMGLVSSDGEKGEQRTRLFGNSRPKTSVKYITALSFG